MPISDAKAKANKKWNQNNKLKNQMYNDKSRTKNFIQNLANIDDLKEIEKMITTRKELLDDIKWFNDTITPEIMKFDGTKNVIALTGFDLLTDDYIDAPEEIEKDKSYIMDNDDFYEIGTREIENFIKDFPMLTAMHKAEILDKLGY